MNGLLRKSWLRRAMAVGLSAALMGGVSLLGAAPAHAVDTYSVSGVVSNSAGGPLAGVTAKFVIPDPGFSDTVLTVITEDDGTFLFEGIANGDYTATFTLAGYGDATAEFNIDGADEDKNVTMLEELTFGTVAITGTPVVGNTLTAVTDDWAADTSLTYEWIFDSTENGINLIDGETASTYTVTDSVVTHSVGVVVTGALEGYAKVSVLAVMADQASAPEKAAAPAPTNLADYLAINGSTPAAQTSTGLPEGSLNPGTAYTADVDWTSGDSFVDVYVFSTPTLVGTFPVVGGVAQITLSTALLGQLAAGNHTLVVTGQSSGAVQSVDLSVAEALAATGFDAAGLVTVASLLALMGGALVLVRRRIGVRS